MNCKLTTKKLKIPVSAPINCSYDVLFCAFCSRCSCQTEKMYVGNTPPDEAKTGRQYSLHADMAQKRMGTKKGAPLSPNLC